MGRTPDRMPGESYEEKLVLEDVGLTADNPGEMVFSNGVFMMRDVDGVAEVVFDEDTILVSRTTGHTLVARPTGNVIVGR